MKAHSSHKMIRTIILPVVVILTSGMNTETSQQTAPDLSAILIVLSMVVGLVYSVVGGFWLASYARKHNRRGLEILARVGVFLFVLNLLLFPLIYLMVRTQSGMQTLPEPCPECNHTKGTINFTFEGPDAEKATFKPIDILIGMAGVIALPFILFAIFEYAISGNWITDNAGVDAAFMTEGMETATVNLGSVVFFVGAACLPFIPLYHIENKLQARRKSTKIPHYQCASCDHQW